MPSKVFANEEERAAARNASYKRYREKNIEAIRARAREHAKKKYLEDRGRVLAQKKAWNRSPKGRAYEAKARLRKYGLTREQFVEMLAAQRGCCALCYRPFKPRDVTSWRNGQPLNASGAVIDHDHATGRVRGLLHTGCNTGIGYFEDDPELLRLAVAYLVSRGNG